MTHLRALVFGLLFLTAPLLVAQQATQQSKPAKHRVILHLNSSTGWDQIFRNVENVQTAFGAEGLQVEIVFYGKGLPMLLKSNTAYADRLKEAHDKGVNLVACQASMRASKVTTEDLFSFASQVDSGVAELVRKQEAGWTYIKAGE
jgi:intracellular sulfur oxidation DsrE/DsrF family protein